MCYTNFRVVIVGGDEQATKKFAASITQVVSQVHDPLPLATISCALDSALARVRVPVSYIQSTEFNRSYINASRAAQIATGGSGDGIDCWIAPMDSKLQLTHLAADAGGVPQIEVAPSGSSMVAREVAMSVDAEELPPEVTEEEWQQETNNEDRAMQRKLLTLSTGLAVTYGDVLLDDLRRHLSENSVRADFKVPVDTSVHSLNYYHCLLEFQPLFI